MDRLKRLVVQPGVEADYPAIMAIFEARPGAYKPQWQVFPGSSLFVVRDLTDEAICAFAILRPDLERRQYTVDALECERGLEHATVRGICAMKVFGAWLETYVTEQGGGEIFSCVGAENRVHEQALLKSGYSDRVHILSKFVGGAV